MALSIRETFGGLEHLRIAACRKLFGMAQDSYLKRYANKGIPVEIALDTNAQPINCELCGFVLIKANFKNGWQMEMCSALPIVDLDNAAFTGWLTTLSKGASGATDCQMRDFEPILHE